MKKNVCLPLFVCAALVYGRPQPLAAQEANTGGRPGSYLVFDAGVPTGMNAQGTVVGYQDASLNPNNCNSFYRLADGTTGIFSAPGIQCDGQEGTIALAINAAGTIVGEYYTVDLAYSFIRDAQGVFTTLKVPNSQGDGAYAINSSGAVVGIYEDFSNVQNIYLRDPEGNYTSFVVPCSDYCVSVGGLYINAGGTIAGTYEDARVHGFVREPGGPLRLLQIPNPYAKDIFVTNIDDAGRIYGYFGANLDSYYDGFIRDQFGNYTIINHSSDDISFLPRATDHADTIVGSYAKSGALSPGAQGFYRLRGGKTVFFNPPGSVETIPRAVDPQGDITGIFYVNDSVYHSFIRLGNDTPISGATANAAP